MPKYRVMSKLWSVNVVVDKTVRDISSSFFNVLITMNFSLRKIYKDMVGSCGSGTTTTRK